MEKCVITYYEKVFEDDYDVYYEFNDYKEMLEKIDSELDCGKTIEVSRVAEDGNLHLICCNDKYYNIAEFEKDYPFMGRLKIRMPNEEEKYIPINLYTTSCARGEGSVIVEITLDFFINDKAMESIKTTINDWLNRYLPSVKFQYGKFAFNVKIDVSKEFIME